MGTDYQSIRLKSGSPEDGDDDKTYADWRVEDFDDHDGQFNATAFDSFDDAVSEMRNYGSANNVECAVWKLSDGSTVFITDSEATSDSMTIPYLESNISTDAIGHYHPSGDGEMSDDDWDAFDDWHEAGVDTSLIITQDSVYTYTYE